MGRHGRKPYIATAEIRARLMREHVLDSFSLQLENITGPGRKWSMPTDAPERYESRVRLEKRATIPRLSVRYEPDHVSRRSWTWIAAIAALLAVLSWCAAGRIIHPRA